MSLCFRFVQRGSIPNANYLGNKTYPDYITVQSGLYTSVTLLTGNVNCTQISNPVSGLWFAAVYLNEEHQDQAVSKVGK